MIRITDGTVLTFDKERPLLAPGGVVVENHEIVDVGPDSELAAKYPHAETMSASGHIVMPGLVNAHTHLYSSLARGIPLPPGAPANFVEILERLWWRLDRGLTPEDVYVSAQAGAVEAVRRGTTTLFDHHSSPNAVEDSLSSIAKATSEVGLRACLSYEVSDRDGKAVSKAGLEENERFIRDCQAENDPLLRGLIGLHASFTVNNQTLERARKICEKYFIGFHLHVAEDTFDLQDSLLKYEKRVVQRLHDTGILGEWTLAAHGVHIDEHEMDILHTSQTPLVHNPRSNMNNAVGTADVPQMLKRGVLVGLGTDGYGQGLFAEFSALALIHKAIKKDPQALSLETAGEILFQNNPEIVNRIFGLTVGRIAPGFAADLILLKYFSPTPLNPTNILSHLLFGLAPFPRVEHVMIHGQWVLRNGEFQLVNEAEIMDHSRRRAEAIWARFQQSE
jgi:putative selenium metabolism protein SsnA